MRLAALCLPLLLASCGAKQAVVKDTVSSKPVAASTVTDKQNDGVGKLTFVQKVSDNQVYSKNITGSMSFTMQMGSKDITVPGALRMRKDEVIRLQLFIPILGTEVGRLEFTPTYVLIIDRLHKEYIKADYTQVDFLKKQGITFYSLQALFWNQLLLPGSQKVSESDLKKFDANLAVQGDAVPVTYKNGDMTYTWMADRSTGRIDQARIDFKSAQYGTSTLHLQYGDFKSVGVKLFPASQNLTLTTDAGNQKREVEINIDMNDVKTDSNWDTQTEISSKYKQVSPQEALSKIMNM